MNRRGFLTGIIAACAAPAIVRSGLIMPIKPALVTPTLEDLRAIDAILEDHVADAMRYAFRDVFERAAAEILNSGTAIIMSNGPNINFCGGMKDLYERA